MKITKTQIENLKTFRNFLKISVNRNYYGQLYCHSYFNTSAIGIIAHAKLFAGNNVQYDNVNFGFANNIESTNNKTIAENSLNFWGEYLYKVVFSSESVVYDETPGLYQYDALVEVINNVIAEYENDSSANVAAQAVQAVQSDIKVHASRLSQIAELLQHLSADDKVRYGLVDADAGKMASDAELLTRFA